MNIFFNVYFWLTIMWVCTSGIELLPNIRAFRNEQVKFPRFTYIEATLVVDIILGSTFFGMMLSGIMIFVSLFKAIGTVQDLIGLIVMVPLFATAKIVQEKITGETKVSWKSLALLVTLVMEIGSFATTFAFYVCMCHSKFESMSDFWGGVICFTMADVLCLVVVAVSAVALVMLKKDAAEDPKEGVLKYHLKWLPVFNPIVSPVTIPIIIVFVPLFFLGKWICNTVRNMVKK